MIYSYIKPQNGIFGPSWTSLSWTFRTSGVHAKLGAAFSRRLRVELAVMRRVDELVNRSWVVHVGTAQVALNRMTHDQSFFGSAKVYVSHFGIHFSRSIYRYTDDP